MVSAKGNPRSEVDLAGDSETGADGVLALPARLARYSKARRIALEVQSFAHENGHVKEANRLADCGNYLTFRNYYTIDQVRLQAARFCRIHLLCPLCAIRRGSKMLKAYLDRYTVLHDKYPDLKPYLVTTTVRNGPDLGERFQHLRSGLRQMGQARSNYLKGKGPWVEYAHSLGGVQSIETTNKGKGWHPHSHGIWLCASEPSEEALKRQWRGWTGDSDQCNIKLITDPVSGFVEVFKYAVKVSVMRPDLTFQAYEVFRSRRLIDSHGLMRGVKIPKSLLDVPLENLPFEELFYRYLARSGYSFTGSRLGYQGSKDSDPVYFDSETGEIPSA